MKPYHILVVGTEKSGRIIASGAARLGARTALIDLDDRAALDPSLSLDLLKRAVQLGQSFEETKESVIGRMEQEREHLARSGVDLYRGSVRFLSQHEMEVDKERLSAKKWVIAPGRVPRLPEIEGLLEAGFATPDTFFMRETFPKKIVILGGGVTGCEWGQALARFGGQVTIVETRSRLLGEEEAEFAHLLERTLQQEGLRIRTGCQLKKVVRRVNKKIVQLEFDGMVEAIEADEIFVATGSKPALEKISGLEQAGVTLCQKGIEVDEYLQTTSPSIFAVGGATGRKAYWGADEAEGEAVLMQSLFGLRSSLEKDFPRVVWTEPEMFWIGLNISEAKRKWDRIEEKVFRFPHPEGNPNMEEEAWLRLLINPQGEWVGAQAAGRNVSAWVGPLLEAKKRKKAITREALAGAWKSAQCSLYHPPVRLFWEDDWTNGWIGKAMRWYFRQFV